MKYILIVVMCGLFCSSLCAQWVNTTYNISNGSYGGSARTIQNGNSAQTTFYNQNGSYVGNARTFQTGNTANTTYYNANGLYGGTSRTTSFGIRRLPSIMERMALQTGDL